MKPKIYLNYLVAAILTAPLLNLLIDSGGITAGKLVCIVLLFSNLLLASLFHQERVKNRGETITTRG
ncbi:hypothetical protein [Shewanella atlantica]|uniref:Uncharacterized protein n=1 Tax=Shewanella atlantica TaxID=271099 RepID=A0A431W945_9GAMM|nr:hypothetical protein [Shewanella atlantica]RTR32002.1 hypothetical protein EKG39_11245 [Shewanella atlantica]